MKKSFLFILFLFSAFCLVACSGSTAAPANFQINEGIASWDEVSGATKYRLEFVGETTIKRVVNETSVDLSSLDLPYGDYTVNVQAILAKGETEYTTANLPYTSEDTSLKVNSLVGTEMMDGRFVKWMGRTDYNTEKNYNTVFHSASGFEVKFVGTTVECELEVTQASNASRRPYVVIMIDDNYETRTRVALDKTSMTLKIAELTEDDGEVHTVTFLKSSESIDSHIYVKSITTNGHFVEGVEYKERKIEVIAASSSTGYGNIPAAGDTQKTSANSDCIQAFAYLTARDLNAEINIYSASGWGCKFSNWTSPKTLNMFDAYKKVDMFSSKDWSYGNYIPDVVVINLGTNDFSYINAAGSDANLKKERTEAFYEQYLAFLDFLHQIYPNAKIIMFYGLMLESYAYEITREIYEEAKLSNPDLAIIQVAGDARGIASHPSASSHRQVADDLIAKIKEEMGW